jgi:hypothetical protein
MACDVSEDVVRLHPLGVLHRRVDLRAVWLGKYRQ